MRNGFIALPDWLTYSEEYSSLTMEEKVVYSAIKRRWDLSVTNGDRWRDKHGDIYCNYSVEDVMALIGRSKGTAIKRLDSLEAKGLITRINHGQGKPAFIYVHVPESAASEPSNDNASQKSKNQTSESPKNEPLEASKTNSYKFKNSTSASSKAELPEVPELHPSYKEYSYPETSYPYPSNPFNRSNRKTDVISARAVNYWTARIRNQVGYDGLKEYAPGLIDNITETMAHIVLSRETTFRVGKSNYEAQVVKQKIIKANWQTVKHIIDSLRSCHTVIRDPYLYLIQCIMRADSTFHIKNATNGVNYTE